MTYEILVTEALKEVFPEADAEEIISRTCPHDFFENADDSCKGLCDDCWGREIEEA